MRCSLPPRSGKSLIPEDNPPPAELPAAALMAWRRMSSPQGECLLLQRRHKGAAPNAGFAVNSGLSLHHYRIAEVDPYQTLVTTPPGELLHRKTDYSAPCNRAMPMDA